MIEEDLGYGKMNPFEEDACWSVLDDYNTINDFDVSEFYLISPSSSTTAGISLTSSISVEKGLKRVREQKKTSFSSDSKASRERLRREKLNDRFSELSKFLHPGRPAKAEKSSVLADAICMLTKLKSEHQELKERKEKLETDTQNLKVERNELREEKLQLLENKQKIEQQIKTMPVAAPGGFVPMQHAVYQAGGNKGLVVPGCGGGYPMWQWIPPAVLDTSQDHVLRPPVA